MQKRTSGAVKVSIMDPLLQAALQQHAVDLGQIASFFAGILCGMVMVLTIQHS